MKGLKYYLCVAIALLSVQLAAADIKRMEPAFWWVGMNNPEVQIMVYGDNIANAHVSIEYPGVQVKEIVGLENPNYLLIYINVTPEAQPGTMNIVFTEGKKETVKTFELKARDQRTRALGFNSKDVLYLIMPDRFANGNTDNDVLDNVPVNRNGGGRHGGDIAGIENKLDYLKDLGITAIWLNPVQYNASGASHGYSITDFYLIDPRLGSNQEYCQLVDNAHEKGIKVVMDMIFNHCGSQHWWIYDLPTSDWFNNEKYTKLASEQAKNPPIRTQGQRPQGQQGQPQQGQPQQWQQGQQGRQERNRVDDGYVQTTHYKWSLMDIHAPQTEKDILIDGWFTRGMPDLNQRNRHLAFYLIQNSIWWIEYSCIDGIRMDTYPYADYDFMVDWCEAIENQYPDFNIVGEGWYPRNSAAAWWQRNSAVNDNNSKLKTVMDFDFTFTTFNQIDNVSSSREQSEAGLFKVYEVLTQDFLFPDPNNVLVFLDNHDLTRFMRPESALWRFKQGVSLLLTTRGIPQLYYGTEILMGKEGSRDNRSDFPGGWPGDQVNAFTQAGRTPEQNEAWNYLSKLLHWRSSSVATTEGQLIHYTPDNTCCYVYARIKDDHRVLVILNGSDKEQALPMKRFSEVIAGCTKGKDVVTGQTMSVEGTMTIPAREAYVLDLSK